jgi:MFS family permease
MSCPAVIALIGTITALGGLAQSFRPVRRLPTVRGAPAARPTAPAPTRCWSISSVPCASRWSSPCSSSAYIGGTSIGAIVGGQLIGWTGTLPATVSVLGLPIFNWQLVLLMIGVPGLVAGLLYMLVREPPRRSPPEASRLTDPDAPLGRKFAAFMGWDALKAIWQRKAVFLPLFAALAMSAVESQGLIPWRVPFVARTYGWNEAEIGALLGSLMLVSMLAGITVGGVFVTWLGKRYKDANIRATRESSSPAPPLSR